VENAREKEDQAKKIINDLKAEVSQLNKIVHEGSGIAMGQDNAV
jgi:hypothetical protein